MNGQQSAEYLIRKEKIVKELQRDADRYRWLRIYALRDDANGELQLCRGIRCHRASNNLPDIDGAIDEAMKGEKG